MNRLAANPSARAAVVLALLAITAIPSLACSDGPAGRPPPVVTTDSQREPSPSGSSNGGGDDTESPGPSDQATATAPCSDDGGAAPATSSAQGESSDPEPPCQALALCCNRFKAGDPGQEWCQETLVSAMQPADCIGFLEYWGC